MSDNDMRTLLEEGPSDVADCCKKGSLEAICFSVIACRQPGYGGHRSDKIGARMVNRHYVIISTEMLRDGEKVLAVLGTKSFGRAHRRMYEEAMKVAKERAKFDGDRVLDLTSFRKRKKLSSGDLCYVDERDLHRYR